MTDPIEPLRRQIDDIDRELLRLFNERAKLAQTVGAAKKAAGEAVLFRPEREAQILARRQAENGGPLPNAAIAQLYRELMSACMALEAPLTIAYLGPEGTFSQAAALKAFGSSVSTLACNTIDEVFRTVEARQADYAVVPVENSTEGAVGRTLDLMLVTPLSACGEVQLEVHQNVMSRAGGLGAIRRVYSHSQSLAQCNGWLNANLPLAERIPVASNAEAARRAAAEPEAAAIAGEMAARIYDVPVLARHVEDDPNNRTRFLVIGAQTVPPSGRDQTSLVMSAPNRPGAVHALLAPFARHGVSMTRLESRPSRMGRWEYYFFVDVQGHEKDAAVGAALAELRELAPFVKLLGSYPAAAH
ncbi:MAG: prephenate dehydratase [Betaproteobacteria bacterium]